MTGYSSPFLLGMISGRKFLALQDLVTRIHRELGFLSVMGAMFAKRKGLQD
jgi:hypothetical protein